jgi:hypothetical protein
LLLNQIDYKVVFQIIMTALAYQPLRTYSPLPSTFQLIEYPTRYVHDKFVETLKSEIKPRWQISLERIYAFRLLKTYTGFELDNFNRVKWYVPGIVVYPLIFCGTSLTILADMIVGIAETAFCCYHGFSKYDLLEIAKRKIIVSPVQQLMYLMMSSVIPALTLLSFLSIPRSRRGLECSNKYHWIAMAALFWYPNYYLGQEWAGRLPRYLNYHRFNIFIGGGARNEFGENYQRSSEGWKARWKDFKTSNFKPSSQPKHHERVPPSQPGVDHVDWKEFLKERFSDISRLADPSLPRDYAQFKEKVFNNSSPLELLDLKPGHSEQELRKATKKYYLALQPRSQ